MSNVSKIWRSGTWRLGKTRAKEPEMVESPLPYNWSPTHDHEKRQDPWSDGADENALKQHQESFHYEKGQDEQSQSYQQMSKKVSLQTPYGHSELLVFQGRQKLQLFDNLPVDFCSASDTAEVHESSESVASSHTKKPSYMRSESTGSLQLSSHDYVVKERDYAEATLKASQNVELERDLKSAMEYAAKLEMLLEEKLVEAHTSANHIRTLEVRLQEANQNIGAIHRKSNQPRKSVSASLDAESEEDLNMQVPTASSDLDVTRLQAELAQLERRYSETKQALELKTTEATVMKERVHKLEGQVTHSEEAQGSVRRLIADLKEEVAKLQADQVAFQLQLELEITNNIRSEEEWSMEREELKAQVAHLETELQLSSCSNGELDFLMTPAKKGYSDLAMDSPRTSNGLSIQALLDMGEASLEVEDDLHDLQMILADAEVREQNASRELAVKEQELEELRGKTKQLEEELVAEKTKAQEEAEDLTQEMAELRYQLMEMIEQERELRAQTEQASVLRVEELEAQIRNIRQEVVQALACRREAEMQSDKWILDIRRLQLALKKSEQDLKEANEGARQVQLSLETEAKQASKNVACLTEAKADLEKQVRELFAANDCLSSENLQLRGSLGEAVATTANLAKKLEEKEIALHAILDQVSKESETVPEVESETVPEVETVVLASHQEAGGRTQEEFGCAQATQTFTFWDSRPQEGVPSKSVDDMKDKWGTSKLVSITDISELKIETDDSLPHTNSRNSQENDTVKFMENEDPLLKRVKIQVENLDELRLENEKLQFELQEIQLQATCYDLDADISRLTTGVLESKDSDVDHCYSRTGRSTEVQDSPGPGLQEADEHSKAEEIAVKKETQQHPIFLGLQGFGVPSTPDLQDKFVCTIKQDSTCAEEQLTGGIDIISEEITKEPMLANGGNQSTHELESHSRSWINVSSEDWGEFNVHQGQVAVNKEVTVLMDECDRLEETLPEEQSIFTQKLAVEEGSERFPTSELGESESQLKLKNKEQNHQLLTKTNDVGSCYFEAQEPPIFEDKLD